MKILAINGSYRKNSFSDLTLDYIHTISNKNSIDFEILHLRDFKNINFCIKCRKCTQLKSEKRGKCIFNDDMNKIIQKIEKSDGYILISPTNFYTITAIFKRFLERLVVYTNWSFDNKAPDYKLKATKKSICITSSAMPSLIGKTFTTSLKYLKYSSRCMGARIEDTLFFGDKTKKHVQSLNSKEIKMLDKSFKKVFLS